MLSIVVHSGSGLDDYTLHLANALSAFARVGYSIDAKQKDRFGSGLNSNVTPIVFNRPRMRQMSGFREMHKLSRAIRQFRPDLLHLQGDGLWESVLLRMVGSLPVVNTIHDPIKHIDQRNYLNNTLMLDAIRRARAWVVHSEGLKQIFSKQNHVNPNYILVHPHGILNYYSRLIPEKVQRDKYILFFGELRFNKGYDILLRAFDLIKDRIPGWKIVVAGRGQVNKSMRVLMGCLGDRLIYHNRFVGDDEVGDLFSRAGIVVLPYRHGSQSGVLAIAAAFGCPVVATSVGSMPEIMENRKQVLFVEPESETSLAAGILSLAQDSELRIEIGKNLEQRANTEWSWEAIASLTIKLYERVLSPI